ncbi:MAG: PAS domain-containing protein [Gaiellales bacterium]
MSRQRVIPIDRESPFEVDELFFSTTDRKGIIRSGNDVFVRVSGWSFPELVGAPHNLIRHPDMPRAVFKLLWDTISVGGTVAAYVKNMAKDGSYYWVLAVVEPVGDGYLSVRMKPTSPVLATVAGLYASVAAEETRLEESGVPRKEAIAASTKLLLDGLNAAGFPDYASFMRLVIPTELAARESAMSRESHRRRAGGSTLAEIVTSCGTLHDYLSTLFANLDSYRSLSEALQRKSTFVLGLADDIRLFSLNALIASTRLDHGGASLSVISDIMRDRSRETAAIIGDLDERVAEVKPLLQDLGFELGIAKLQTEMTLGFAESLALSERDEADDHLIRDDILALTTCLSQSVATIVDRLGRVDAQLSQVAHHVGRLAHQLRFLEALHLNGRVEAARLDSSAAFGQLFAEIGGQIEAAGREIGEFGALANNSAMRASTVGPDAVRHELEKLEALVAVLTAETDTPADEQPERDDALELATR